MTTPPAPTRPRQVTLAAWLIMGGSVLVVLTVFERMSGLHSLETRQAVEKFLSEPPGDGLGVGVSGVLDALRVFCMVAAGCATAAAILGYQVLQRSRSARIALTVLAAPLFVSGLISGGFVSSVVAASAVMLWFQPARDWFDGVVRESRPATQARPTQAGDVWPPPLPPTVSSPTPDQQSTQPPTEPPTQPPAWGGAQPALPLANPAVRPPGVVWACLLTWVFAGLALLVMGLSITMLATSPGLVFDELHRQNPDLAATGVSDATLRSATFVIGGVVAAWSLIALVVAVLAFRRVRWARAALVVSAAGSVACCLFATLGQFLVVVPLAASVVTLALLVRPEVRAWYDAPGRVRP